MIMEAVCMILVGLFVQQDELSNVFVFWGFF